MSGSRQLVSEWPRGSLRTHRRKGLCSQWMAKRWSTTETTPSTFVCWVARVGVEELVGQSVIICVEALENLCIEVVVSMFVFEG